MRMEAFQTILRRFAIMGVHSEQLTKEHILNASNVTVLLVFVASSIAAHIYFWFQANTFIEYGDSFYEMSCVTVSNIDFVVVLCNMPKLFRFIEHLETFIVKS